MTIYKALNIKAFMNALLKSDVFDNFELREININTFASFSINGKKAEEENFKRMQELKIKAAEALTNAGVITKQDYEMIKNELRNILLNQEKIKFINQFQQSLYNDAVENGEIKYFENE